MNDRRGFGHRVNVPFDPLIWRGYGSSAAVDASKNTNFAWPSTSGTIPGTRAVTMYLQLWKLSWLRKSDAIWLGLSNPSTSTQLVKARFTWYNAHTTTLLPTTVLDAAKEYPALALSAAAALYTGSTSCQLYRFPVNSQWELPDGWLWLAGMYEHAYTGAGAETAPTAFGADYRISVGSGGSGSSRDLAYTAALGSGIATAFPTLDGTMTNLSGSTTTTVAQANLGIGCVR